jgi:hypothetical protein
MSQSEDQKTQAMEKVSDLGDQLDLGGEDLSNAFDELRSGNLEAQRLASFGEAIGRQGGALLGQRVGEAIGWKFADEDGVLSFSSIIGTLRRSGSGESEGEGQRDQGEEEGEAADEDAEDAESAAGDEGDGGNEGSEASEEANGDESEPEIEGDGSGSFEDMSDDELRNLANDLMDELDRRESSES